MSLKVWLPLDGDLRNLGASGIEVTNNGATVDNSGKIGKCYHFGTSNSYIQIPKEAMTTFTTDCSISFWLKINTWNSSYATFFQAGLGSIPWAHYIFGFLRNSTNSTICFTISNGSSASNASYLTSTIELNKWYHITLTYTTGKCKIYLNGLLDHEYVTSIIPAFSSITTITLGRDNSNNYQTDCNINDFRIYDHCLSAAEVREIAQGLVVHYKLDGGVTTAKNLIKNGYGELGSTNWDSSAYFSSEVPSGHPEIKKSIYSNTTIEYIPIENTHSYKLEAYLKNSATSGNTYPSLYPYDIDKNFIYVYNCPESFNLSTMTFLTQELKSGDTKIYVNDLSKWNANSGTYYNYAAIFNYNDSTGYVYPNGTYTRDTPAFGSSNTAKTNLDKTNNIITLNSAYSGPTKPVGTAICAATAGSTYYYPFGGLTKSSLNDWTYKTATMIPNNIPRLKYAKYIRYSTYDGTLHAGIKLIDLADDIDSTIISDSSGYGHNGTLNSSSTLNTNSPRYSSSLYFSPNIIVTGNNLFSQGTLLSEFTWMGWVRRKYDDGKSRVIHSGPINVGLYTDYSLLIGWKSAKTDGTTTRNGAAGGSTTVPLNTWTHICITYKDGIINFYINGNNTRTSNYSSYGTFIEAYGQNYLGANNWNGDLSDIRIYATALLDTDIKLLYNMGMRVDNLGGVHAFEFNEISNEKLLKTGILQTNEFEETSTQLARLQKDKGWFSSDFIEI